MNTKTITNHASSVIEQYRYFKVGPASCSIPYFNNNTVKARMALRVNSGKGSPKELFEEIQTILARAHVAINSLTDEALKKILTDNNLGIDCSGFAYYVLNAEFLELKKCSIDKHIYFVNCHGLLGKIRAKLRPVENCDVATLAHDKNSSIISVNDVLPGDMITMSSQGNNQASSAITLASINERDHILVIHQVEYQNYSPIKIHYSHAVSYPEDGVYGTGIKQGTIEISEPNKSITDALWSENGKRGQENRIFVRAVKSKTEIRRLK